MFKVLFVYHNPLEDGYIPVAIASLAGMLKKYGIDTKLFDTTFWRDESELHLQENRLVREKLGGYKKVEGYSRQREIVNITEKFKQIVEEYKPNLIAATSTSSEFKSLLRFILPAKKEFNIPLIVGGSHPTADPEKVINSDGVDAVCIGEGEWPLLEFIQKMENNEDLTNIPSLWIKKVNGEIIRNLIRPQYENLDVLPEPDWDLFDEKHRIRPFEGELKRYGYFEMSRGCPYNCSYCLNSRLHKLKTSDGKMFSSYRFHTPKEMIRIIKKYKEKYGFNHIQFIDENMANLPVKVLKEFAELYKKEIDVSFFVQSRPEAFVNNPEKARIMADMGCKIIGIGVESANMDLCKTILNRPMREGVVEEAVKILKEAGIMVAAYYIIGFPTETKEMIKQTIELHRRLKPNRFSVRFLYPYPGTPIRELLIKMGYFNESFDEKEYEGSYFTDPILDLPSPPHPTKEELKQLRDEFAIIASEWK